MGETGAVVEGWKVPPPPGPAVLEGRYTRLERLDSGHSAQLHEAFSASADGSLWTYLSHGPFRGIGDFASWVTKASKGADPFFYAIMDAAGRPSGVASYLRITPEHGTIEVGWITLAPRLQRTPAATEAMILMANWAFGAGYRRYEWKCDALNAPSRAAAERLGFSFEGIFRQHMIVKGRNRDTAWFSITDAEWPALRGAWEAWLDPGNFDAEGRQLARLGDLIADARAGGGRESVA